MENTKLASFQELKKWLNLDFDDNKDSIEAMACGIEGYITFGTGLDLATLAEVRPIAYVLARNYLQQKLYMQYYGTYDEHVEASCQAIIEQLKILAVSG
ncbi:MAG: hypothetical protein K2O94_00895 [Clostridiales bacterium]|nr:hypothetical protein [Clostridiales bacterium]